jgi:hypothetical protein
MARNRRRSSRRKASSAEDVRAFLVSIPYDADGGGISKIFFFLSGNIHRKSALRFGLLTFMVSS